MNSTSLQNHQSFSIQTLHNFIDLLAKGLPPNEIAINLREIAEKIESTKKNKKKGVFNFFLNNYSSRFQIKTNPRNCN